jgi:hypothetical protein
MNHSVTIFYQARTAMNKLDKFYNYIFNLNNCGIFSKNLGDI